VKSRSIILSQARGVGHGTSGQIIGVLANFSRCAGGVALRIQRRVSLN
jgi:hypothetical protein